MIRPLVAFGFCLIAGAAYAIPAFAQGLGYGVAICCFLASILVLVTWLDDVLPKG